MTRIDDSAHLDLGQWSPGRSADARAAKPDFSTRVAALGIGRISVLRIVGLAVAGFADVALAVPAFNGVLRGSTWLSLGCAIAFSVITVLSAYSSGREAKLRRPGLAVLAAVASVGFIAGLFVLRILAAFLQGSSQGVGYEGAGQQTDTVTPEVWTAVVFALLMLGTSAVAFIDGFATTQRPEAAELRILDAHLATAEDDVAVGRGLVTRLVEDSAMAEYQLARIDTDLEQERHELDSIARELRELARHEVVKHLGSPEAASGLDLALPSDGPTDREASSSTGDGSDSDNHND